MKIRMMSTMAASAALLTAAACGADEAAAPRMDDQGNYETQTETQTDTGYGMDTGTATTEADTGLGMDTDMSSSAATDTGMTGPGNVAEIAMDDARLTTLVAAIQAAGLGETLAGDGPFTVFAPTNDAFYALPAGTLEELLLPENQERLKGILTFHVVPGRVMSADLAGKSMEADTVNGAKLSVDATGDSVMIGNATVVQADIEASNGVIHIIDTVLIPSAE